MCSSSREADYSFVSDHATITMAMGVALFVADRRFGVVGIGLALVEGFCRVYMGVHYPTDVIGGFALGTAVALLLSPLAMALLTPVLKAVEGSAWGGWVVSSAGVRRVVIPGRGPRRPMRRSGTSRRDGRYSLAPLGCALPGLISSAPASSPYNPCGYVKKWAGSYCFFRVVRRVAASP